jgi:hypothetical protein
VVGGPPIPLGVRGQRFHRGINTGLEAAQQRFGFPITREDLLLIHSRELPGLFERKQMLRPPRAHQRFLNGLRTGFDAANPQLGQFDRVALAGDDGIDNRQPGGPGEVADHMVNLQIHLRQRLISPW